MIPKTDLDYVEFYARKLKKDNSIFNQQIKLIDSQLFSSASFFRGWFGTGKQFKKQARIYLKNIGKL